MIVKQLPTGFSVTPGPADSRLSSRGASSRSANLTKVRVDGLEGIVAGVSDRAAALLKSGGAKAKSNGDKLYALAKDPEVHAKIRGLAEDGKKVYDFATSPQAKRAYKQALEIIKKARQK